MRKKPKLTPLDQVFPKLTPEQQDQEIKEFLEKADRDIFHKHWWSNSHVRWGGSPCWKYYHSHDAVCAKNSSRRAESKRSGCSGRQQPPRTIRQSKNSSNWGRRIIGYSQRLRNGQYEQLIRQKSSIGGLYDGH